MLDCPWLHQLPTYGRRRGAFRPAEDRCARRADLRPRATVLRSRSAPVPHRQQAWHLLHVQLPNVRSDSTGLTGLPILRAMVRGERDPHTLAAYRHAHGATSEEAMANAFTGNYRPAHLVARTQALELSDFYHQHITACDQAIRLDRRITE